MDKIFPEKFYGDTSRWWIGVVEDINDPMQLGRVRVRIHGIHSQSQDDIQTTDLPWAQTIIPTTEGGISGIGRSNGLLPGAGVFGFFLDGRASQVPVVFGSMARVELPSRIQSNLESNTSKYLSDVAKESAPSGTGTTGARNFPRPDNKITSGIEGSTNAEKAFNYFVNYGFTEKQSAGIVGNLAQESGAKLDPNAEAAGAEQSFGIAQWNSAEAAGNRFKLLREFSDDIGEPWNTLETQLQFITWELENFSYLGLADVKKAITIEEAVVAFETKYERPSSPKRSSRIRFAEEIYERMTRNA